MRWIQLRGSGLTPRLNQPRDSRFTSCAFLLSDHLPKGRPRTHPKSVNLDRAERWGFVAHTTTMCQVYFSLMIFWICALLWWIIYRHMLVAQSLVQSFCKQEQAIVPADHFEIWSYTLNESKTEGHRSEVVEWLRGAVMIPYVRPQFDLQG